MKVFGIAVAAVVAALALGVGIVGNTPSASAETTAVRSVSCLLLAGAVDGNPDDAVDPPTDYPLACATQLTQAQVSTMATALGDRDSTLEASDLDEADQFDGNQLQEGCNSTATSFPFCVILVFAFVNDEKPVLLDNPSGLTSIQAGFAATDFLCDTDGDTGTFGQDNDCSDVATNGDGVVIFHVVNDSPGGASRGSTSTVYVEQESVAQSFDLNVVGAPNNIILTLVETTIGTSGNSSALSACQTGVDVLDAIAPSNATLAYVQAYDQDDRLLTMVPVGMAISPPAEVDTVAAFGVGDADLDILGTTALTVDPGDDVPIAFYQVICGGRGTGVTDIVATLDTNLDDVSEDTSTAELTVVGAPSSVVLTAAPSEIACDGVTSSTVTAVIADSAGNPVADGTEVNFSVVALGTANPINTVTAGGQASSVITPLSNASAGVTVIVTAGDSSIASVVQASTLVNCALPIHIDPTATVPSGTVTPPDTGTGLGDQGGSFLSLWTLVALAIGGAVIVTGGMVARRNER